MTGVPAVLLDQVGDQSAQVGVLTVDGHMCRLVQPTVRHCRTQPCPRPLDRVVPCGLEVRHPPAHRPTRTINGMTPATS